MLVEEFPAYLVRQGLGQAEQFVDGPCYLLDVSRRNRVVKVVVPGGGGLLVRQPMNPDNPTSSAGLAVEAALLGAMVPQGALAPLAPYVPRLVHHDATASVVVTELMHPATTLGKFHLNHGQIHFPPEAGEGPGRILAAIRVAGEDAARAGALPGLANAPPGPWAFLEGLAGSAGALPPAWSELRDLLRARPSVLETLPELRHRWASRADLVHGDIRWDNLLVGAGEGPEGGLNLLLIDWEMAGRGDAAWDVACFLGEYARFWLAMAEAFGIEDLASARRRAPFALPTSAPAVQAFWRTYRHRIARPDEGLLSRAADYLPLVLAVIATEPLVGAAELPGLSVAAAELAAEAAEDPRGWLGDHLGLEVTR